jgi:hypothetical protein
MASALSFPFLSGGDRDIGTVGEGSSREVFMMFVSQGIGVI